MEIQVSLHALVENLDMQAAELQGTSMGVCYLQTLFCVRIYDSQEASVYMSFTLCAAAKFRASLRAWLIVNGL